MARRVGGQSDAGGRCSSTFEVVMVAMETLLDGAQEKVCLLSSKDKLLRQVLVGGGAGQWLQPLHTCVRNLSNSSRGLGQRMLPASYCHLDLDAAHDGASEEPWSAHKMRTKYLFGDEMSFH